VKIEHPQAKLVWVMQGEVFDALIDLRRKSPTFGQVWYTVLSASNRRQLYIPVGLAHGFYPGMPHSRKS
jgi:dTDP-4-dehydrorhamnose 3,5-epimerase